MDETVEQDLPRPETASDRGGLRARDLLMAAFIGFSKALGWDENLPSEEIVAISPDLDSGGLDLIFDGLEPLD